VCYLYTQADFKGFVSNPDYKSGHTQQPTLQIIQQPATQQSTSGLFIIKSGTDVEGVPFQTAGRSDIECERSCAQSANCKVFSYNIPNQVCYLYTQADFKGFVSNPDYKSGQRN
jgi:hypothetical protein